MVADARLTTIRELADSWARRLAGVVIPQVGHLNALGSRAVVTVLADGRSRTAAERLAGELRSALRAFAESAVAFRAAARRLVAVIDEVSNDPRGK